MWTGIGMSLLVEAAAFLWIAVSVFLSILTWHDAWYHARTRLWAAAVIVFGAPAFAVYVYWSRFRVYKLQDGAICPSYQIRLRRRQYSEVPVSEGASSKSVSASESSGADSSIAVRSELPRCPVCRTAISFYDVKCIKCGHIVGGIGPNAV